MGMNELKDSSYGRLLSLALFNVGDTFCAIDNTCTHQGGPLGEGESPRRPPRPTSRRASPLPCEIRLSDTDVLPQPKRSPSRG
jgi:hypothetical protein